MGIRTAKDLTAKHPRNHQITDKFRLSSDLVDGIDPRDTLPNDF
jgi:hypothetical protein